MNTFYPQTSRGVGLPTDAAERLDTPAGMHPAEMRWQVTLVDGCCYGRIGLQAALQQHFSSSGNWSVMAIDSLERLFSDIPSYRMKGHPKRGESAQDLLVVRLPLVPQAALALLLQLEEVSVASYPRIVVLSHIEPDVVRRILYSVRPGSAVRIMDARLAASELCQLIMSSTEKSFNEISPYKPALVFNRGERRALAQTLREISVHEQAHVRRVSTKTIYTHRSGALFKLGAKNVLALLRWFITDTARRDGEKP
jgi:DNA-binding CsgD family transcriptional regulator